MLGPTWLTMLRRLRVQTSTQHAWCRWWSAAEVIWHRLPFVRETLLPEIVEARISSKNYVQLFLTDSRLFTWLRNVLVASQIKMVICRIPVVRWAFTNCPVNRDYWSECLGHRTNRKVSLVTSGNLLIHVKMSFGLWFAWKCWVQLMEQSWFGWTTFRLKPLESRRNKFLGIDSNLCDYQQFAHTTIWSLCLVRMWLRAGTIGDGVISPRLDT